MSYGNGSYYLPPSRPLSAQSPSDRLGQSSIKARLAFSSINSPTPKRPVVSHNFTGMNRSSSATPPLNGHYQNRVGEYHMSRQNPDVLDQMYSPNQNTRSSGEGMYAVGKQDSLYTSFGKANGQHLSSPGPRLGGTGAVSQVSFLRQMLNSRRARSASPGLVQLANRNGLGRSGRLLKNGVIGGSPVTVKLAGVKRMAEKDKMQPSGMQSMMNGSDHNQRVPNPCDKEVVLSALRQKSRKRWASSMPEENPANLPTPPLATPLPKAKRSRTDNVVQTETIGTSVVGTNDRKRSHATPASVPSLKRSKVVDGIGASNVLSLSEAEEEKVSGPGISTFRSSSNNEVKSIAPIAAIVSNGLGGGRGSRGHTPPIVIDEAEMDRKRDESLNSLKAVFTSSNEAKKLDTLRRKLPIFCATGSKPHLPSPLSATHSVTGEDLRKDKEATAARLKAFLEADDEEDETDGVAPLTKPTTQLETAKPLTTSLTQSSGLKLATTNVGASSSLATKLGPTVSASSGLTLTTTTVAVTKPLPAKTVSFAPLPELTKSSQVLSSSTSAAPSSGTIFSGSLGPSSNLAPLSQHVNSQSGEGQGLKLVAAAVSLSLSDLTQQKSGANQLSTVTPLSSTATSAANATTSKEHTLSKPLQASSLQLASSTQNSGSLFQPNAASSASLSSLVFSMKPLTTTPATTVAPTNVPPQLTQSNTLPTTSTGQTAFSFKVAGSQPANSQLSLGAGLFGNPAASLPNLHAETQSSKGLSAVTASQAPSTFGLAAAGQSLFNSNAPQTTAQASKPSSQPSIFNQNSTQASIFNHQNSQTATQPSLFKQNSTQPSIFNQTSLTTTTQPAIFNQNSLTTTQPSLFGTQKDTLPAPIFGKSQAPASQTFSFNFSSGGAAVSTASVQNAPGLRQGGGQTLQFNFGTGGGGVASQQGASGLFNNNSTSSTAKQSLNLPGQTNVFNPGQTGQASLFGKSLSVPNPNPLSVNFSGNPQAVPPSGGGFGGQQQQQANSQPASTFQFGLNTSSATAGQQSQPFAFNQQPTMNFGTGMNQQQTGNVFGGGGGNMFQSSPSINFSAPAGTEVSTPRKMVTARRRRKK